MAKVAAGLRRPFMPWQAHVANVSHELNRAGYLQYRLVVLVVPRQSGKSALLQAVMVRASLGAYDATTLYTAQDRTEARRRLLVELHQRTLARSRGFRRRYTTRATNGDEALTFVTGSTIGIVAPTATAGHGNTLDLAVIDEAFAQTSLALPQAFGPAMVTRRNAQLWVVSVVGDGSDTLLQHYQAQGEAAVDDPTSRIAYFEWSDLTGDVYDEATWWGCMPALGFTIYPDDVRADPVYGDPDEFARAYLCRRRRTTTATALDVAAWHGAARDDVQLADPVSFAFDVSIDRTAAAIAAASPTADGYAVELVEHRPGVRWVIRRLVDLNARHRPQWIGLDATGPAGALLVDLERHRLPLRPLNGTDVARACGAFTDDVADARIAHLGQDPLDAAVADAGRSYTGDQFRWRRRSQVVDLSPLYAVTLARYGAAGGPGEAIIRSGA